MTNARTRLECKITMDPVCLQYFTVDGAQYLKLQGQRRFIDVLAKELESIRRPYRARDRKMYTFKEFVDFFGWRRGTNEWEAARDSEKSGETLSTKCEAPQENAESGIKVVVFRESSAIVPESRGRRYRKVQGFVVLTLENTDLHNVEFRRIKEVAVNHIKRLETHVTCCLQDDDVELGCR